MAGQPDGVGEAVFDQPSLGGAEQFGERVAQGDGGNAGEKFGKGHDSLR